jgi:Tat protein translocase TatB subunit
MLGLGLGEILVISALVLVVVGPDRLPQLMRWAGKSYAQLRRAADDLRRAFMLEADRVDAEERYRKLMERREESREAHRRAKESAGLDTEPQDRGLPAAEAEEPEPAAPDTAADPGDEGPPDPGDEGPPDPTSGGEP